MRGRGLSLPWFSARSHTAPTPPHGVARASTPSRRVHAHFLAIPHTVPHTVLSRFVTRFLSRPPSPPPPVLPGSSHSPTRLPPSSQSSAPSSKNVPEGLSHDSHAVRPHHLTRFLRLHEATHNSPLTPSASLTVPRTFVTPSFPGFPRSSAHRFAHRSSRCPHTHPHALTRYSPEFLTQLAPCTPSHALPHTSACRSRTALYRPRECSSRSLP